LVHPLTWSGWATFVAHRQIKRGNSVSHFASRQ
jgi:hypothetical protein